MSDLLFEDVVPGDEKAELEGLIREALSHFYDYAVLARHPLTERLAPLFGEKSGAPVQHLRRVLLDAIESLKPNSAVPRSVSSWRPYLVLYERYVLGKETDDLAESLHVGVRQIQREQRRGLVAIALKLQNELGAVERDAVSATGASALRLEINAVAPKTEWFDPSEQIENTVVSLATLAERYDVHLDSHTPSNVGVVEGNPALCKQMLVVLLSHLVRSERVSNVEISLRHEGSRVSCLIEAHWKKSILPEERQIVMPDHAVALAQAQEIDWSQETSSLAWLANLRLSVHRTRKQVAIVEDNRDLVMLFSRYLLQHGYDLVAVPHGNEAISQILEIAPRAVILDIMMSNTDGWELLQKIRSEPRLASMPVIMCSVLAEQELAASLGATAYLQKPVRPYELVSCLSAVCN